MPPGSHPHRATSLPRSRAALLPVLLALTLTACGGGGGTSAPPPPPAQVQSIQLSSVGSSTEAGGSAVPLSASLAFSADISWQLASGNPGALSATSGATVNYLPPASVAAVTQVTITATSGGVSKTIQLTLYPAGDRPGLRLLAGDEGGAGQIDGSGTLARMNSIMAVASDADGNLYSAEVGPAIRKTTPSGAVSTLVSTTAGYIDGDRNTARIGKPTSLAVAAGGVIYFVEGSVYDNPGLEHAVPIRKLAADGSISTVATITLGMEDRLRLVIDSSGKLYAVQDQRISTVSASGGVTTLAGAVVSGPVRPVVDGPATSARFRAIGSVTADRGGNLYLSDAASLLRKVAADGSVSTIAGKLPPDVLSGPIAPVDGTGSNAVFASLGSLAVNAAGNVVALDTSSLGFVGPTRALRIVTPAGATSTVALSDQDGGLLATGAGSTLYLIHNTQINTLGADGSSTVFAGMEKSRSLDVDGSGATARFNAGASAIGADGAGNLYVIDTGPGGLHVLPSGLALRKITSAGVVSTVLRSSDVRYASGLAVDTAGNSYVSEYATYISAAADNGGVVYKITPAGAMTTLAGAAGTSTDQQDGTGTAARFTRPTLAGIDADGNLYVNDVALDTTTHVRKITPAGVVSTIAALPAGLQTVSDAGGNVYTTDSAQGVVYRTPPGGTPAVVAGTAGKNVNYAGDLPGYLERPSSLVRTGPYSFAVLSGGAIMRLVAPH
jgi:hypothetical protein